MSTEVSKIINSGGNILNKQLEYRIAIIGNPTFSDLRYDDSQLLNLKKLGFNTVQLNIAWGCRPANEPLNLEDVVSLPGEVEDIEVINNRKELIRRIKKCKEYGFRTIFHFGAPKAKNRYYDSIDDCIQLDEIKEKYKRLLIQLSELCPGIDDILVYTYDQYAWLCDEFGDCPRCNTVPLHERLPQFINLLQSTWKRINTEGIMWWEPWELSAGQSLTIIPLLPKRGFGLMLHSNIAEVQATRPVDCWFRNMVRLANENGIPVVGEAFLSSCSEEVEPLQNIMTPRLVYQQIKAISSVEGIVGVKEYYGLLPDRNDFNIYMAGEVFNNIEIELDEALHNITKYFGEYQNDAINAFEQTTSAFEFYPWDISWFIREVGYLNPCHGWNRAIIRGTCANSPSWMSTRNAIFMKTQDDFSPNPWLLEDLSLRLKLAVNKFDDAIEIYKSIISQAHEEIKNCVTKILDDNIKFKINAQTYQYHIEESMISIHIENYRKAGREIPEKLYKKLRDLLEKDAENQRGYYPAVNNIKTAEEMLKEFDENPNEWTLKYLQNAKEYSNTNNEINCFILGLTTA
jgi:hypothetical protein